MGQEDPLEKEMASHSSYSCLRNRMDRGVWWATVHGAAKDLDTIKWLNNNKTTALNNIEELPWWSSG